MHKGIIILTKANDVEEAENNVSDFMILYKDSVWDWWQLGGRWSSLLETSPLGECIELVNEWKQNVNHAIKAEEEAKQWLNYKNSNGDIVADYGMYGYCLVKAGNLYQQKFYNNTNVYNMETSDYSIPEEVFGWYAVMIDIHY